MVIHPEARTTPQIRAERKASRGASDVARMEFTEYGKMVHYRVRHE